MAKTAITLFFSSLILFVFSCNSKVKTKAKINENKPHWKNANYIDSVQILLRNDYKFTEANGYGASAFLVKAKENTLLCTAKHLLGDAMGIEPEIQTNEFNSSLEYWKAFPNGDKLSTDTIIRMEINYLQIRLQVQN